jgi:hypothetical protein
VTAMMVGSVSCFVFWGLGHGIFKIKLTNAVAIEAQRKLAAIVERLTSYARQ